MFTGIVRAVGTLTSRSSRGADQRLHISPGSLDMSRINIGDSLAVNGVCLTVAGSSGDAVAFDLAPQTCSLTTLAQLPVACAVNLEPALTLADPLGGHLVTGHVDAVAKLAAREQQNGSAVLHFTFPAELMPYVCVRGAVCIDGVSLTVAAVAADTVTVQCIPHTLGHTNMGKLQSGAAVNVEVDMLARYVSRLMSFGDQI